MNEKITEFIEKSRLTHGCKYDYSKVEYKNNYTKVCIICPKHGEFWQAPYAHKRGDGCPICANERRGQFKNLTQDEFIEKARKAHGDKYDYSKVEYKNIMTKICIICPIHGEFWQIPANHIYKQKQGCPKCLNRCLTTEEIIDKFKGVHGDKYDYSKVVYDKMHSKVCIICPTHGEFYQTPSKHINGQGCPKCGIISRTEKKTKTTEQFIKEAKAIHNDKYDYSKAEYKNAFEKVCIICPKHGEFWQRAFDHLHNHGCPFCNESSLERDIKKMLIDNNIEFVEQCNKSSLEWLDKQSLDFYLPKYKTAIECQGSQHFRPVEHFGGDEEFKIVKERDRRKLQKCLDNGIRILYYSSIENCGCISDKEQLLEEIKKANGNGNEKQN